MNGKIFSVGDIMEFKCLLKGLVMQGFFEWKGATFFSGFYSEYYRKSWNPNDHNLKVKISIHHIYINKIIYKTYNKWIILSQLIRYVCSVIYHIFQPLNTNIC